MQRGPASPRGRQPPARTQQQPRSMPRSQPQQDDDRDEWFPGFGDATARRQTNYIPPGDYVLEVELMQRKSSQNPRKRGDQIFVAEFTVVEVIVAHEAEYDDKGNPLFAETLKPGQRCSLVKNTTEHGESALRVMKSLFLAIAQNTNPDLVEEEVTPEQWQATLLDATDPPGTSTQGHQVRCSATKGWTRAGGPFTNTSFLPYAAPGELPAPQARKAPVPPPPRQTAPRRGPARANPLPEDSDEVDEDIPF